MRVLFFFLALALLGHAQDSTEAIAELQTQLQTIAQQLRQQDAAARSAQASILDTLGTLSGSIASLSSSVSPLSKSVSNLQKPLDDATAFLKQAASNPAGKVDLGPMQASIASLADKIAPLGSSLGSVEKSANSQAADLKSLAEQTIKNADVLKTLQHQVAALRPLVEASKAGDTSKAVSALAAEVAELKAVLHAIRESQLEAQKGFMQTHVHPVLESVKNAAVLEKAGAVASTCFEKSKEHAGNAFNHVHKLTSELKAHEHLSNLAEKGQQVGKKGLEEAHAQLKGVLETHAVPKGLPPTMVDYMSKGVIGFVLLLAGLVVLRILKTVVCLFCCCGRTRKTEVKKDKKKGNDKKNK